jgi:hypothetical protein
VCFAYLSYVAGVEKKFGVTGIAKEDSYDLLGTERETFKAQGYGGQNRTVGNYSTPVTTMGGGQDGAEDKAVERCLVIEVWIRDGRIASTEKTEVVAADEAGNQTSQTIETPIPVYRDGIRKITIARVKTPPKDTKAGYGVLDDNPNPNLNPALPDDAAKTTHPWGRLPVYHVNSYEDLVSIYGFSAAEQTGDLLLEINKIVSKLINYVINVVAPPLIVQQHCGITRDMIEGTIQKAGRLVLMPTTPNARIEFMQVPNLPETFFRVLDLIVSFFDRIYQIEDADRGKTPSRIVAASAIVALQERNAVVMQSKTVAIDSIAEQRSRWAIGLWQNFGFKEETVNVSADDMRPFVGTDLAGRKLSYVIEAGSTTPRTSLQQQDLAMALFDKKAISQRGLLETLRWPNWKEELERTAETNLDVALQILVQAGLPPEVAMALKERLAQSQGGPGDAPGKETKMGAAEPKPGVPVAQQGEAV